MLPTDCFPSESPQRAPQLPVTQTAWDLLSPEPRGVCPGNGSSLHTTPPAQQQAPLRWEPGLAMGETRMHTEGKNQDTPVPAAPYAVPKALLQFLQAPTVVFRFDKAFVFPPPPPSLVILEIALSEDKV